MDNEHTFDLTPEQSHAFNELKRRIHGDYGEEVADDFRIYRFLKARNFNIKNAENMLKENIHWRQAQKIDTITENYKIPEIIEKYFSMYALGFDIDGSLIMFIEIGNMDIKGMLKCLSKETILLHSACYLQLAEHHLKENSRKLGKPIDKWISVLDCKNLSLLKATNKQFLDVFLAISSQYEQNYPERLKVLYAINASPAFTLLYNIGKPLLSAETLSKFRIFGSDGWQEVFKEFMGPDLSHLYFNRQTLKTYKDLTPLTPISFGGIVPEEYYYKNSAEQLKCKSDISKHILRSNESFTVPVIVSVVDSVLEWEFETANNDIGFELSYKNDNETVMKVIIPLQKINTEYCSSTGRHLCKEIGIYNLTFDNTHSWVRWKHLYYKYSVTPLQKEAIK